MRTVKTATGASGRSAMAARWGGRALLLVAGFGLGGCISEVPAGGGSPGAAPGYGYVCYAGVYSCRVPQQLPVGTHCSCPGIGAPSFGDIR